MTIGLKNIEIDSRLRGLINDRYGDRGKFSLLEQSSGIAAMKWKNFFYKRQSANEQMLNFWCEKYPEDKQWLLTGVRPPKQDGYPFLTKVPNFGGGSTIGQRLSWVIAEWASPSGAALFSYLEEKSDGKISAGDWANVIMRITEPTLEMVSLVAENRPHFTQWIVCGWAGGEVQVDPTSEASINRWESTRGAIWKENFGDFAGKAIEAMEDQPDSSKPTEEEVRVLVDAFFSQISKRRRKK